MAIPSWIQLLCLQWLSRQNRLCKLIHLGQGLGHGMRQGCPMCTQKINLSSGRVHPLYLARREASTSAKKPKTLVAFGPILDVHLPTLTRSWRHSSTRKRHWRPLECNTHTSQSTYSFIKYRVLCNGATFIAGNLWCCFPEWCICWCCFLGVSGRGWRHQVWMCCSLQPSDESLASAQASHGLMHYVPTVSPRQCWGRRGTSPNREVKDGGRWTRQTAIILQRSCRSTRTISMLSQLTFTTSSTGRLR